VDIANKKPPAHRPSSLPGTLRALWVLFESCWKLEPTSRPSAEGVMTSHKQWHAAYERSRPVKPNLMTGPSHSHTLQGRSKSPANLSRAIIMNESVPKGYGGYSDVYIGRLGDLQVCLRSA